MAEGVGDMMITSVYTLVCFGPCCNRRMQVGGHSQQGIIRKNLAARDEDPTPLQEEVTTVAKKDRP